MSILRFLFCGLLAAFTNVVGWTQMVTATRDLQGGQLAIYPELRLAYGFPLKFMQRAHQDGGVEAQEAAFRLAEDVVQFSWWALFLNIAIWVGLFGLNELRLRLRARRRSDSPPPASRDGRLKHTLGSLVMLTLLVVLVGAASAWAHRKFAGQSQRQADAFAEWVMLEDRVGFRDATWHQFGPGYLRAPQGSLTDRWLSSYDWIWAVETRAQELHALRHFPTLRFVSLDLVPGQHDLSVLEALPNLQTLELSEPFLWNQESDSSRQTEIILPSLPHLEYLDISISGSQIRGLAQLTQLRVCQLANCRLERTDLEQLAQLENLESLYLYQTEVKEADVRWLEQQMTSCQIAFTATDATRPRDPIEQLVQQALEHTRREQEQRPAIEEIVMRHSISPEVTSITEPLDRFGQPDYLAAINQQEAAGVTLENNAAVPLLKLIRPTTTQASLWDRLARALDIESESITEPRFIDFEEFCWRRKIDPDSIEMPSLAELDFGGQDPTLALVDEWLATNSDGLGLAQQALRNERFFMPLVAAETEPAQVMNSEIEWTGGLQAMARAFSYRARRRIAQREFRDAIDDLKATRAMAQQLQRSPTAVIRVQAMALHGLAMASEYELLQSKNVPIDLIGDYQVWIEARPPKPAFHQCVDKIDRFMILEAGTKLASKRMTLNDLSNSSDRGEQKEFPVENIDWDVFLRTVNASYDGQVQALQTEKIPERIEAAAKVLEELDAAGESATGIGALAAGFFDRETRSQNVARILVVLMSPALKTYSVIEARVEIEHRLHIAALGMRRYLNDHSSPPEDWQTLVPVYLATVPVDPFTEKPLHFHVTDDRVEIGSTGLQQYFAKPANPFIKPRGSSWVYSFQRP